jgi:hypothetical protein
MINELLKKEKRYESVFHSFYLLGSSDQTNNGSEISDPDVLIC